MAAKQSTPTEKAIAVFRERGGILRTSEALHLDIHPHTLYMLRESGEIQQLSRGLYRLADLPPLSNADFVIVARRIPQSVICLISALAFHELTTQVPHAVHIALPRGPRAPVLDYPPLRVYRFSGPAWSEGLDTHLIDSVPVRIYSAAKSVADCFKYRNKIGLDVALEALKNYRQRRDFDMDSLVKYSRVCRVERVMHPYLEALL